MLPERRAAPEARWRGFEVGVRGERWHGPSYSTPLLLTDQTCRVCNFLTFFGEKLLLGGGDRGPTPRGHAHQEASSQRRR